MAQPREPHIEADRDTLRGVPDVWFIRHAPAAGNLDGRFMGRLDVKVDAEGLTTAAALEGTVPAEVVISSPLRRAAHTAVAIFPDHDIRLDERLAERHFGAWQGREKAEVRADRPDAFTDAGTLDLTVTPPDGESLAELCTRVHAVLQELADGPPDAQVALVAHNAVLRSARILLGLLTVEQASVTPEPFARPSCVRVDVTTLQPVDAAIAAGA
ncbi:MAG: phosphoglycerate mutase family protein [Solirubrobacterales bacterium]|nr:phosphoglycerate mutase family protein [Solirubrobacterales bacterium]